VLLLDQIRYVYIIMTFPHTQVAQFIVIRTFVDELEGRKVKVSGRIEDIDGNTLVEAK
jgi:hypothetical protein